MVTQARGNGISAKSLIDARIDPVAIRWTILILSACLLLGLKQAGTLAPAPSASVVPLADWISVAMNWFTGHFTPLFREITWLLSFPFHWIRAVLLWLPWLAVLVFVAGLGLMASGWKLALFAALGMMYIVLTGYWDETALTLAAVCVALPLSVGIGLYIGILGARSRAARRIIDPTLDLMQTIPTFAYLIPIVLLFGIGPVIGMTASAIYAVPPMVRNVMLALERVPPEITEAGIMAGSNRPQLTWWVQIPTGMPTILVGINQTVMAGLSMVVIAAMVAGVNDIGLEVFITMKQAKFGQSLLAGLVVAILAMITDRITRGFATRSGEHVSTDGCRQRWLFIGILAAMALVVALAHVVPALRSYPNEWVFYPVRQMNAALDKFTVATFPVTSAIKTWTLFYLMLPFKIGLADSVRPNFWGFAMSPTVSAVFALFSASLCLALWRAWNWRAAMGGAVITVFYYFGTTGVPWPLVVGLFTLLGYECGGWRVSGVALIGLLFIVLTGQWTEAMVSIALCAIAVLISFVLGGALGLWAALNDRVSNVLSPICDTLQTIPIFVFLIPAIMVFLVGEFTALIATIMYAIVPMIRYTEHGIRNVPESVSEAARSSGTTPLQRLTQVQIPMALPEIMLGLNQTIMMALAMVVVAALVGAQGLGQEIMIALTEANMGKGLVSGLSISLLAIIADRTIQAWASSRKQALGLD